MRDSAQGGGGWSAIYLLGVEKDDRQLTDGKLAPMGGDPSFIPASAAS